MDNDPGRRGATLERALDLEQRGELREALAQLRELIASAPLDPVAHAHAGAIAASLEDWGRSIAHRRVTVAVAPHQASGWSNLSTALRGGGHLEGAEAAARQATAMDPSLSAAWIGLGLVALDRGQFSQAREQFLRALALDPRSPHAITNLGIAEHGLGRDEEAFASFARALEIDPRLAPAHYNKGALHHERGEHTDAIRHYREAIALRPADAASHFNLGTALFITGRFEEAWPEYGWRADRPEPPALRDTSARVTIRAEQGLGDVLFFLRFAPAVRAAGATLEFVGDVRLHPMLARTGLFDSLAERPTETGAEDVAVRASDVALLLPGLAATTPPPLALSADRSRLAAMRSRLEALGPAPYVAVAWRAGEPKAVGVATLFKEVPLPKLGEALRGVKATWLAIQRDPRAGEMDALSQAVGAPVHDLSAVNTDLEDALALVACVDEYVGVSSTMVHLRSGVGGSARILVPIPYEWRWMATGDASPWFPRATVYRQGADHDWNPALARLARDLATSR